MHPQTHGCLFSTPKHCIVDFAGPCKTCFNVCLKLKPDHSTLNLQGLEDIHMLEFDDKVEFISSLAPMRPLKADIVRAHSSWRATETLAAAKRPPHTLCTLICSAHSLSPWSRFVRADPTLARAEVQVWHLLLPAWRVYQSLAGCLLMMQVRKLAPCFSILEFKAKDVIVRQGEKADGECCMLLLHTVKPGQQGRHTLLIPSALCASTS